MEFFDNDRWIGRIPLTLNTDYLYTIEAWRERFVSWRAEVIKKRAAGRDLHLELEEGRILVRKAAARAHGRYRETLEALLVFFFNDPAPPEIYTLSLHDALPILFSLALPLGARFSVDAVAAAKREGLAPGEVPESARRPVVSLAMLGLILQFSAIYFFNAISKGRSEEHTSELQSLAYLVCRLLLE